MSNDIEPDLTAAIESGDRRRSLLGIRDHIVRELDGHRCDRCAMSQMKTGDQAALILRLEKVLAAIEEIDANDRQSRKRSEAAGNLPSLDALRASRSAAATGAKPSRRRGVSGGR